MRRVAAERGDARWALWMAGAAMIALVSSGWRERQRGVVVPQDGRGAPATAAVVGTASVLGAAMPASR